MEREKKVHAGHRQRMRERLMKNGMDSLQDHEVLELLLFYAIPRQDTNELAHRLIARFRSLPGVLEAPVEELKRVAGMGENAAVFLHLFPAVFQRCLREEKKNVRRLFSYQEFGEYMKAQLYGRSREAVALLLLNSKNQILFCGQLYEGSATAVEIYMKDLVRLASRYDAVGAVLAHNHPSGECLPSVEDLRTTELAAETLRNIDVALLDHIIVGGEDFVSLAASGILPHTFPEAEPAPRQVKKAAERGKKTRE